MPVALSEGGCQTSSYEIDDAMNAGVSTEDQLMGVGETDADDPAGLSSGVRELVTDIVNVAKVSPGCLLDVNDLARPLALQITRTSHVRRETLMYHRLVVPVSSVVQEQAWRPEERAALVLVGEERHLR